MTFQSKNKEIRDRMRRWRSFCETNRGLIERIRLPTPTIETAERFADLLMHGRIDHHDDWSGFRVRQLSSEQYGMFTLLIDRYFAAGYNDPGLMAVDHEQRVRLATKYPEQFDGSLVELVNRQKNGEHN